MTSRKTVDKLKSLVTVCTGAAGVCTILSYFNNNEQLFEKFVLPIAHSLDPETAHKLAVSAYKYKLTPVPKRADDPILASNVWGINFGNPVGLAAGFDKDGEGIEGLHQCGFGFVEIGSVTPVPQEGNEKPRVFRLLKDKAIINRYGFNSDGHESVALKLKTLKSNIGSKAYVVGVNLGKNKNSPDPISEYTTGIQKLGPYADYLVINVSSPNTPGLRDLQKKERLQNLLSEVITARNALTVKIPLLLKLSPDLSMQEKKDIADVISSPKCKVDGLIISNTTVSRELELSDAQQNEQGGLSGQPLASTSTRMIAEMYSLTNGEVPIVGVGGVFTGEDAYEKIKAGARLIQIYTSFIYHGPPRIERIKRELTALLKKDGFNSIEEAVGQASKQQSVAVGASK